MHLKPQIIMQVTGCMLLHDEATTAALPAASRSNRRRFIRSIEVSFRVVFGQVFGWGRRPAASWSAQRADPTNKLLRQFLLELQYGGEEITGLLQPLQSFLRREVE